MVEIRPRNLELERAKVGYMFGEEHRVGHGSIFADPVQSNP